ncbi:hypothetical protein TSAR_001484 [Trichomalopsis sarcophagae]|uniref:Uncharacterized protein n=1 Tax=Trichomalopsis sarcophagae TaxID=543379 RepID=A0A232EU07_9HYME|nr:hypothetical protein TSAR_001484 [Trichomalopsis sarcophagae]
MYISMPLLHMTSVNVESAAAKRIVVEHTKRVNTKTDARLRRITNNNKVSQVLLTSASDAQRPQSFL